MADISCLRKLQAAKDAQGPTHPKMDDDLSILPNSMRKSFLASMNRNREAFTELAKL